MNHLLTHQGLKNVPCPICQKKFHGESLVKNHIRHVHNKKNDKQCTDCGKTFKTNSALVDHVRSHSDELPFQCLKCGKKFQREMVYRKHLRNHEKDEIGFCVVCQVCGKSFKRNEALKNHMTFHSGLKEYKCMYCQKDFYTKHQLRQHVISMHLSTQQFKCKLCDFQMRVRKKFQKVYATHAREMHSHEMTPQEMEMFELEIRKLSYDDICSGLPGSLKKFRDVAHCSQCSVQFQSAKQLKEHALEVHNKTIL